MEQACWAGVGLKGGLGLKKARDCWAIGEFGFERVVFCFGLGREK